jgi:biofilm PGA synthesis protein PgaD
MESLIINKRHELPRSKRLMWDIATVLLWIGWIYLWKPLIVVFYQILTLKAGPDEMTDVILQNTSVIPFHHAIFMLIATPLVLFILSRLNRHKSSSEHLLYEANEYANYFHVDNIQLQECINSQLITVYHDDHGQITRLENMIDKK